MWTTLVTAEELLPALERADVRFLDCRHQLLDPEWGPRQYAEAHIPGAVHAHIDRDLSDPPRPTSGRHPLPDPKRLRDTFGRWGIDETVQVVVYDDQGGVWAARAWWLLQDYGHRNVALLDGGLDAWRKAGGHVTQESPNIPARMFRGEPGHRPRIEATELLARLDAGAFMVLDARAPERYSGEKEPVDPVAGHIPGAESLPVHSLLTPEKTFVPREDLRARLLRRMSNEPPAQVAAYCGSGVTASFLVLAFEAAGLGSIRLYPGSWSEWIRDPNRPVARGEEPASGRTAHV